MNVIIFAALVVFVAFNHCDTFKVYNCSVPESDLEYETVSLVDLPKCEYKNVKSKTERIDAYIVQELRRKTITVRKCLVTVFRSTYNCETGSSDGSTLEYKRRTDPTECADMHENRKYNYYGRKWIKNLQVNHTYSISAVLAGSMDKKKGSCTGENFHDEYSTLANAVVQERYDIQLQQFSSIVGTVSRELSLPNGFRCHLDKRPCADNDGAVYLWELEREPHDELMDDVVVIYNGELDLVTYPDSLTNYSFQESDHRYAVLNNAKNFAAIRLKTKTKSFIRNREIEIYKTNVPDLYVFEWKYRDRLPINVSLADSDVSLNIQYLAKLTGVDVHLFQQLSQLVSLSLYNDCVMNRANLEIKVSIAYTNPSEFAYLYNGGPGAKAYVSGDVIHIIRCPVVDDSIPFVIPNVCYQTIPVLISGKRMFANARTGILQDSDTPIPCPGIRGALIKDGDEWLNVTEGNQKLTSSIVKPIRFAEDSSNILNTWRYESMSNIISGGVYSYEQIEKSREAVSYRTSYSSGDDSWSHKIIIDGSEESTTAGGILRWLLSVLIAFWYFFSAIGKMITCIVGAWFVFEMTSFLFWMMVELFALGFSWRLLKAFCRQTTAAVRPMLTKRFSATKKYVVRQMRCVANSYENSSPSAIAHSDLEDGSNVAMSKKNNL